MQQRVVDGDAAGHDLRQHPFHLRRFVTEDVQRQRAVTGLHRRDGGVQIRIRTDRQDRAKNLFAHQRQIGRRIEHDGGHDQPLALGTFGIDRGQFDYRHAPRAGFIEIATQALVLAVVDDPGVIGGVAEIAIARLHLGLQLLHQLALAMAVDQHVVRRDAGLAGIEELAGGQARGRLLQRVVAADDGGGFTAQFEGQRGQVLGRGRHDLAADGGGAGEHQVVQRRAGQGAGEVSVALHDRHAIQGEDVGQQRLQEGTGAGRVLGRLEDHVVAGGDRGGQRNQGQVDRVVPG
ncbi:hypothetical protein D3C71_1329180 [compost metagenome]